MKVNIGNKEYAIGKSKTTGLYTVWEQKKSHHEKIFECSHIDNLKSYVKRLKTLANKREMRADIADICGTSYAAAKRDMGGF